MRKEIIKYFRSTNLNGNAKYLVESENNMHFDKWLSGNVYLEYPIKRPSVCACLSMFKLFREKRVSSHEAQVENSLHATEHVT